MIMYFCFLLLSKFKFCQLATLCYQQYGPNESLQKISPIQKRAVKCSIQIFYCIFTITSDFITWGCCHNCPFPQCTTFKLLISEMLLDSIKCRTGWKGSKWNAQTQFQILLTWNKMQSSVIYVDFIYITVLRTKSILNSADNGILPNIYLLTGWNSVHIDLLQWKFMKNDMTTNV